MRSLVLRDILRVVSARRGRNVRLYRRQLNAMIVEVFGDLRLIDQRNADEARHRLFVTLDIAVTSIALLLEASDEEDPSALESELAAFLEDLYERVRNSDSNDTNDT